MYFSFSRKQKKNHFLTTTVNCMSFSPLQSRVSDSAINIDFDEAHREPLLFSSMYLFLSQAQLSRSTMSYLYLSTSCTGKNWQLGCSSLNLWKKPSPVWKCLFSEMIENNQWHGHNGTVQNKHLPALQELSKIHQGTHLYSIGGYLINEFLSQINLCLSLDPRN